MGESTDVASAKRAVRGVCRESPDDELVDSLGRTVTCVIFFSSAKAYCVTERSESESVPAAVSLYRCWAFDILYQIIRQCSEGGCSRRATVRRGTKTKGRKQKAVGHQVNGDGRGKRNPRREVVADGNLERAAYHYAVMSDLFGPGLAHEDQVVRRQMTQGGQAQAPRGEMAHQRSQKWTVLEARHV